MVRAKFRCISKTQTRDGHSVMLEPVTCGGEENEKFFKYTPWGKLEFGTINSFAAEQLTPGKEYYIDISIAEKE